MEAEDWKNLAREASVMLTDGEEGKRVSQRAERESICGEERELK